MGTPLLMVTPLFALSFFGYGLGKTVIAKVTDKTPNPQGKPPLQGQKAVLAAPSHLFCAGAISSCLTTFIVTPVERIKCLLQVQTQSGASNMKSVYRGPLHCATTLLKEGGIPNLYKGFGATLLRGKLGFGIISL
jgi:solute carrier family 25 carnitine/acylcarnitine transporter 20/29